MRGAHLFTLSFTTIFNNIKVTDHDILIKASMFLKRLWDLEEWRPMATSVVGEAARAAAYSPDGQHVAVGLASGAFLVVTAE